MYLSVVNRLTKIVWWRVDGPLNEGAFKPEGSDVHSKRGHFWFLFREALGNRRILASSECAQLILLYIGITLIFIKKIPKIPKVVATEKLATGNLRQT